MKNWIKNNYELVVLGFMLFIMLFMLFMFEYFQVKGTFEGFFPFYGGLLGIISAVFSIIIIRLASK